MGIACLAAATGQEVAARTTDANPARLKNDGVVRVRWSASVHETSGEFVLIRSSGSRDVVVGRMPAGHGGSYFMEDHTGSAGERRYVLVYVDAHGRSHELGERIVSVAGIDAPRESQMAAPTFQPLLAAPVWAPEGLAIAGAPPSDGFRRGFGERARPPVPPPWRTIVAGSGSLQHS